MLRPLSTSFTQSVDEEAGRPQEDIDKLSPEGLKTKEKDKNGTENV